ncbi:aminoglycoside phosphotransferase family protein [uncultured Ruegeria sp.]|uniref:aminoglycoside phosphotransferase family protein n=1 Tax=uncultured Ruegeria sp. TaxID=259304 RepID=UPI0026315AEC|nr:aminoglycoside phosphotransferase family protein [uncultured Ruegeria sp.]
MLYGGRTNRVWKVLSGPSDAVLKLYGAPFQNPMFRNDAQLEADCLRALNNTGYVPNLRATGSIGAASWVYYDHAPGNPWRDGVESVATLLRHLHGLPIDLELPQGCNGSVELREQAEQILLSCQSAEKQRLTALRPEGVVEPLANRRLIHGDPVAGNILQASTGLTLIDWQCPAMGDPCEDLAIFLSPAMQHLYRDATLSEAEVASFLTAYDQREITERYLLLRPWFSWRMAAYCLWRIENGSPDYIPAFELEINEL